MSSTATSWHTNKITQHPPVGRTSSAVASRLIDEARLGPARGILIAVLLAIPLWVAIVAVLYELI
jgi:hypothetical protein